MNTSKLKQPKEIKTGDIVIIIDEEPPYDFYINKYFRIGIITKNNKEDRNYQLLTQDNREIEEIYYTKREYLNVINREENGKTLEYEFYENETEDENWFWDWGWE